MELALLKTQVIYYLKQGGNVLWGKLGFGLLYAALVPHTVALQGLTLLFVMDFLCGVWVARKTKSLSSSGLRRGVAKAFIYTLFISAVALAEHSVLKTGYITTGAIGLLAATELLSITENLVMLGLPIPYGAKVLRMVSQKAKNFGFNFNAEDVNGLGYAKDLVSIITVSVPKLRDPTLRTCMEVFATQWYSFIRELNEEAFMGNRDLARERVRAGLERTIIDAHAIMTRKGVSVIHQRTFLQDWCGAVIGQLIAQAGEVAMSDRVAGSDKPERVREAVALMLYRLLDEVDGIDATVADPLEALKSFKVIPGPLSDLTRPPEPEPGA